VTLLLAALAGRWPPPLLLLPSLFLDGLEFELRRECELRREVLRGKNLVSDR